MTSKTTSKSNAGLPTDEDAFKVMVEIDIIAKTASRLFDRLLQGGMTRAQFGVLNRLARLNQVETISQIARAFHVSQPTMSSTVAKLMEKGLVEARPDPTDGRRKGIVLTPEGYRSRASVLAGLQPVFDLLGASSDLVDWESLLGQLYVIRAELESL